MPGGRGDSTYKASYTGIGQMLNSGMVQDGCVDHAEKIKTYAISISPQGSSSRYRSSFKVHRIRVLHAKTIRAGARVENDAPYAAAVEYGNRANNFKGQRILGKAMLVRF